MTGKLARVMGWLMAGHAWLAGLFWGLLNVPESNVAMLLLSAVLALAILVSAAVVETTAAAWLAPPRDFRAAVRHGFRGIPVFVVALLVFAAAWWVGGRVERWHAVHAGEIDAWLIAHANWITPPWLHRAVAALVFVVRYVIGLALAVAIVCASIVGGFRAVWRLDWVRAGLSRWAIGLTAVTVVLLLAIPARAVYWRPRWLPSSAEIAFVALKLAVLALVAHVGWVLILAAGARAARNPAAGDLGPDPG